MKFWRQLRFDLVLAIHRNARFRSKNILSRSSFQKENRVEDMLLEKLLYIIIICNSFLLLKEDTLFITKKEWNSFEARISVSIEHFNSCVLLRILHSSLPPIVQCIIKMLSIICNIVYIFCFRMFRKFPAS